MESPFTISYYCGQGKTPMGSTHDDNGMSREKRYADNCSAAPAKFESGSIWLSPAGISGDPFAQA
jgi:hypothetical protein